MHIRYSYIFVTPICLLASYLMLNLGDLRPNFWSPDLFLIFNFHSDLCGYLKAKRVLHPLPPELLHILIAKGCPLILLFD